MGIAYFRLPTQALTPLWPLIRAHEAEPVGPRARGYWFDYPDDYDYDSVRETAQTLYEAGRAAALESLELSENEAHSLSLLEVEMPRDGQPFPPALFTSSAGPESALTHVRLARKVLGPDAERAGGRFATNVRDRRMLGYLNKQLRHFRATLPRLWRLYERAAETETGILVVDLRARDLFIPDPIESMEAYQQ